MNMKKSTLIFSVALLAVAIIMYWICGVGTGILMTLVCGALIALHVFLINKNPRWWIIILALIVSISLVRCSFFKLMDEASMKDAEKIVMEIQSEEDDDTPEKTDNYEEKDTSDVVSEDDENSDVVEETEECPEDETQEPEINPEPVVVEKVVEKEVKVPVVVEKVVEKKVEVPVEKEVIKYVEKPSKETNAQTTKPTTSTTSTTTQTNSPVTTPTNNYNYNPAYYGDPTSSSYGHGSNYGYGYTTDPTLNNYGYGYGYSSGYGYTGDPTASGYNNNYYSSSIKITGDTTVVAGDTATYTITGVSSITRSKLDLPDNVSIESINGNRVKLYFEEGWTGTYSIGYESAELKIKVKAN